MSQFSSISCRSHRGAGQHGFTLIEILVVVFIMVLVGSLIALSFTENSNKAVKSEAQQFVALINLASQEAMLQSKEMAVEILDSSYRFLSLEGDKWVPVVDEVFFERELPEAIMMTAMLEGEEIDLLSDEDKAKPGGPKIFLLSSGEKTPFEVIFQAEESLTNFRVTGELVGRAVLQIPEA